MQEYDLALKMLLQRTAKMTMRELAGAEIENWLEVELPKVQSRRADLLGETVGGGLFHLELQSSHDTRMALRMAEYCLGIFRRFGKLPRQVLLYVGEAPLRMETEIAGPDVSFRYRAIDIRDLDGDHLLESEAVGDNIIAILTRLQDQRQAVRRVVGRIARLDPAERDAALGQLLILAGLRRLAGVVEQEVEHMPIDLDIHDHEVIGREYRRGRQEGELKILRRQIEKRFGPLPVWADKRLAARSAAELEELGVRVLDANSIDELLK